MSTANRSDTETPRALVRNFLESHKSIAQPVRQLPRRSVNLPVTESTSSSSRVGTRRRSLQKSRRSTDTETPRTLIHNFLQNHETVAKPVRQLRRRSQAANRRLSSVALNDAEGQQQQTDNTLDDGEDATNEGKEGEAQEDEGVNDEGDDSSFTHAVSSQAHPKESSQAQFIESRQSESPSLQDENSETEKVGLSEHPVEPDVDILLRSSTSLATSVRPTLLRKTEKTRLVSTPIREMYGTPTSAPRKTPTPAKRSRLSQLNRERTTRLSMAAGSARSNELSGFGLGLMAMSPINNQTLNKTGTQTFGVSEMRSRQGGERSFLETSQRDTPRREMNSAETTVRSRFDALERNKSPVVEEKANKSRFETGSMSLVKRSKAVKTSTKVSSISRSQDHEQAVPGTPSESALTGRKKDVMTPSRTESFLLKRKEVDDAPLSGEIQTLSMLQGKDVATQSSRKRSWSHVLQEQSESILSPKEFDGLSNSLRNKTYIPSPVKGSRSPILQSTDENATLHEKRSRSSMLQGNGISTLSPGKDSRSSLLRDNGPSRDQRLSSSIVQSGVPSPSPVRGSRLSYQQEIKASTQSPEQPPTHSTQRKEALSPSSQRWQLSIRQKNDSRAQSPQYGSRSSILQRQSKTMQSPEEFAGLLSPQRREAIAPFSGKTSRSSRINNTKAATPLSRESTSSVAQNETFTHTLATTSASPGKDNRESKRSEPISPHPRNNISKKNSEVMSERARKFFESESKNMSNDVPSVHGPRRSRSKRELRSLDKLGETIPERNLFDTFGPMINIQPGENNEGDSEGEIMDDWQGQEDIADRSDPLHPHDLENDYGPYGHEKTDRGSPKRQNASRHVYSFDENYDTDNGENTAVVENHGGSIMTNDQDDGHDSNRNRDGRDGRDSVPSDNDDDAVGAKGRAETISDAENNEEIARSGQSRLPSQAALKPTKRPGGRITSQRPTTTKRPRPKDTTHPPRLASTLTKQLFRHFARCNVTPGALRQVELVADKFWDNLIQDVAGYAHRAGRKSVTQQDLQLLMYRQGLTSSRMTMYSLVEKYLPIEYQEDIIPMARSGNIVKPKVKLEHRDF